MNKKILGLALLAIFCQASVSATHTEEYANGDENYASDSSCCPTRSYRSSCCPMRARRCCPQRRSCVKQCFPKRRCCPVRRVCRPKNRCCMSCNETSASTRRGGRYVVVADPKAATDNRDDMDDRTDMDDKTDTDNRAARSNASMADQSAERSASNRAGRSTASTREQSSDRSASAPSEDVSEDVTMTEESEMAA